jgi:L-2-hydroxyglutarate oxidase LhgO
MSRLGADFVIIGGGVVGVCLALEARRRHPASRIAVLEKERECGLHASGRNSGVLHAGFYYTADSLKARFTRDGNRAWTEYCAQRRLNLNKCGKLVVARDAADLSGLDELARRAAANGVELHAVTEREAREIEPRAKTLERALFSPSTASVNPPEVMRALVEDARAAKIEIVTETRYLGRAGGGVRTSRGDVDAGYVINAAGLYADRVAHDYGFAGEYRILPFKGLYLYAHEGAAAVRTNIYPVPDLANPFLGVHYTVTVDGKVKIGPTAIPAFWREHYAGLANFNFTELIEIVAREVALFAGDDFHFRRLALAELRKYSKRRMVELAAHLARDVDPRHYTEWGKPGVRAQLLNIRERRLEMDFRFDGDARSFHVLNAVSPAFTCALPFSRYLFDQIEQVAARPGSVAPSLAAVPRR